MKQNIPFSTVALLAASLVVAHAGAKEDATAAAKKLAGALPEDYESSILAPFVDSLSQEIGRALQYFFTSTPHHKVHYVMLAGGTATLPGLKDRVTELTGFASMVVNPFDNMRLGAAIREGKLRREAPSYLTACGLAMRRFLQ